MNITRSVQKWGNGSGVRLPKIVLIAANLQLDEPMNITVKGRSVILTPVQATKKTSLDELLYGVTPKLVGSEHAWGPDVGLENYDD